MVAAAEACQTLARERYAFRNSGAAVAPENLTLPRAADVAEGGGARGGRGGSGLAAPALIQKNRTRPAILYDPTLMTRTCIVP